MPEEDEVNIEKGSVVDKGEVPSLKAMARDKGRQWRHWGWCHRGW